MYGLRSKSFMLKLGPVAITISVQATHDHRYDKSKMSGMVVDCLEIIIKTRPKVASKSEFRNVDDDEMIT